MAAEKEKGACRRVPAHSGREAPPSPEDSSSAPGDSGPGLNALWQSIIDCECGGW